MVVNLIKNIVACSSCLLHDLEGVVFKPCRFSEVKRRCRAVGVFELTCSPKLLRMLTQPRKASSPNKKEDPFHKFHEFLKIKEVDDSAALNLRGSCDSAFECTGCSFRFYDPS
jgi:hypothetical protein